MRGRRYTVRMFRYGVAAVFLGVSLPLLVFAQSVCPALSLGSSGPNVIALQNFLVYAYSNFPQSYVTGYFGTITEEAVQEWQRNNSIVSSGAPSTTGYGSVGPKTAAAMKLSCSAEPNTQSTPSTTGVTATPIPTNGVVSSIRTLSRGISGSDVLALQQFLISQGLLVSGSATGYFGALTEAAVQKYQVQKGIVSSGTPSTTGYGAVGPKTRAVIAANTGSTSLVTSSSATTAPSTSASPSPYVPPTTTTQTNTSQTVMTIGGAGGGTTTSTTPSSCTWSGQSITTGSSVTAYQSSSVPAGQTCVQETRTCSNGTLIGTYTNAACSIAGAAPNPVSIAALRTLSPGASLVQVQGYYSAGDGGGGTFIWNAASTAADNGGSIIAPTSGGTGRWIRSTTPSNTYTPEMFGAYHDGTHNDVPAINAAILALNAQGGSVLKLACNTTYNLASPAPLYGGNSVSEIVPKSGVSINGCGTSSIFRIADNINSLATVNASPGGLGFVSGIYGMLPDVISNVTFSNFTIDMNGTHNDCNGTCWSSNASLGAEKGDSIVVDSVNFINNPGSNDIVLGLDGSSSVLTNLRIVNSTFQYESDRINPSAVDFSAIFVNGTNGTISNNVFNNGPVLNGAAIELHGLNITASGNTISNYFGGANIANEYADGISVPSDSISFTGNTLSNVNVGVTVWARPHTSEDHILVQGNTIGLNPALNPNQPSYGLDADTVVSAQGNNIGLRILGNTIQSAGSSSGVLNDCGITLGAFSSIEVSGNTISNMPGPAICENNIAAGATLAINDNIIANPAFLAPPASIYSTAILMKASINTGSSVSIQRNSISKSPGSISSGVSGALNTSSGIILGNTISGATTPVSWTGSGIPLESAADLQRKQDLQTLASALQSWYQKHNTYGIAGAGSAGSGTGVVSADGSPTIIQALYADGDLNSNALLPANPAAGSDYYLLYICNGGKTFSLSAKLDNPSSADIANIQASCNGTGINGTYSLYGRNYAVTGGT
jgi:peptidoglycan hydrolase-like protein with peptidoglycan-binding domain